MEVFTEQDAYNLGVKDGHEASERGEPLSMGMTWDDNQDFNEAYDRGANAAQKAFVLTRYPGAIAHESGLGWDIYIGQETVLVEGADAEYAAWEQAAVAVGQEPPKQPEVPKSLLRLAEAWVLINKPEKIRVTYAEESGSVIITTIGATFSMEEGLAFLGLLHKHKADGVRIITKHLAR